MGEWMAGRVCEWRDERAGEVGPFDCAPGGCTGYNQEAWGDRGRGFAGRGRKACRKSSRGETAPLGDAAIEPLSAKQIGRSEG